MSSMELTPMEVHLGLHPYILALVPILTPDLDEAMAVDGLGSV